ncbi:hypothetical protein ACF1CG_34000 [Streptomyces sp. NPDC014773]|uniref:hypothetical protein n=1 Tax=Streptomyces sp. NPDC014773 TaxID=3364908 RepID=UPI0036FC8E87
MTDRTAFAQEATPSETRADRRRLVESVRAHRRLLAERGPFEVADRRRLNREARERDRVEARHGKELQRVHEKRVKRERSLTSSLNGLDGKRESQERNALAVLRRESVEQALRSTRLDAGQVNGIGNGLVRDLAAQGIRTAADFRRVSWGKAPNGKGGEVLYIHRTQGRKVHINGIGEHRGRPLAEWQRQALARAQARAPQELPADQRHRIAEIIEEERVRLQAELAEAPRAAEAARAEAARRYEEEAERLAAAEREAAEEAVRRRAGFDTMAEELLALQAELAAHVDRFGDLGLRDRRARSRALRPLPAVPVIPAPRTPEPSPRPAVDLAKQAGAPGVPGAPGVRPGLGWLVPMVFFGLTAVLGPGDDAAAPLWLSISARLASLAVLAELLRLWIPRRRWRTAGPLPAGTGQLAGAVFLALFSASMFADPEHAAGGAPWALAVVSVLLLLAGTTRRAGSGRPGETSD